MVEKAAIDQKTEGATEKRLNLKERVEKLLVLMLNRSVLDPEAREELEEILGRAFPDEDTFADIISAIQETVLTLIEEEPCISDEQTKALVRDIEQLFDEWEKGDFGDVTDFSAFLEEKQKDIQNKIGAEPCFKLNEIPKDASEGVKGEIVAKIADIVKDVIGDVFGRLRNNLPPDARLRLDMEVDKEIEYNIRRHI